MGSFSWLKADNLDPVANVVISQPFKFLIPIEFGGGYIEDKYRDYGYLGYENEELETFDMYEILAFWNHELKIDKDIDLFIYGSSEKLHIPKGTTVGSVLKFDGEFPLMKKIDRYTDFNREIGIEIGCYDSEIDKLEYPLKLVSCSCDDSYEQVNGKSYSDPNQGFSD